MRDRFVLMRDRTPAPTQSHFRSDFIPGIIGGLRLVLDTHPGCIKSAAGEKHHGRASSHPPGFEPRAPNVPRIHRRRVWLFRSARWRPPPGAPTGHRRSMGWAVLPSAAWQPRPRPSRQAPRRAKSRSAGTPIRSATWACRSPTQHGFFAKHNLKVEKINFAGATDQLLELLASGKADAGVGMALGWMKPLEQGFDVKLTAAVHGGCIRLLTTQESGITSVAGLEGQDGRDGQHGEPGQEFHVRSWRSSRASIRPRISNGASTRPICSGSHCRRARSRRSRATIRSPRSSATATIWWR